MPFPRLMLSLVSELKRDLALNVKTAAKKIWHLGVLSLLESVVHTHSSKNSVVFIPNLPFLDHYFDALFITI